MGLKTSKMKDYKPLPDSLSVVKSNIHGYGLFALEDIPSGTELGITHHHLWDEVVRTPLGGFINHSNNPNCRLERVIATSVLYTTIPIKKEEELTLTYKMYKVE